MSTSPSAPQNSQDDASASVAVGGRTSGQQGATPDHESQEETGGNGGPGLTRNQSGPYVNAPDGAASGDPTVSATATSDSVEVLEAGARTETADAAMTHANPGAQDTRSSQAGPRATGLGTPETGGNQDAGDLPPVTP